MVEIDLKVGKGKSRGNKIAVQTELAPTKQVFVRQKACEKLEFGSSAITSILMKPLVNNSIHLQ